MKHVRRVQKKKKKKKFSTATTLKYGIEVPRTVSDAIRIDKASNNTHWQDAMEKEVGALLELDCFYKDIDDTWQRTTLHMVFDHVKQSVDRKA